MARRKTAQREEQDNEIGWYEGRVVLNWTGKRAVLFHPRDCKFCGTWNKETSARRPRPDPCPRCGYTAHLKDNGVPWHKVCREADLTEKLSEGAPPP